MDEQLINRKLQEDHQKFDAYYLWLLEAMPEVFQVEVGHDNFLLIAHALMEFELQEYFSILRLRKISIALCLDHPDADLTILKNYASNGIQSYQAYVSSTPPPFLQLQSKLHIAVVHFFDENFETLDSALSDEFKEELQGLVLEKFPSINSEAFTKAFNTLSPAFLRSLSLERLVLAIGMSCRALTRDQCQYQAQYNEEWEAEGCPSMQLVLAWNDPPKHYFLYRLLRTIYRHNCVVQQISASHMHLYRTNNILVVVLDLHGIGGKPVWEVANIAEFVKELITVKYFASFDMVDRILVQPRLLTGAMGHLIRAMQNFIHQALVHLDVNLYTLEHVEEGLCRHPELTVQLCEIFKLRFSPVHHNLEKYLEISEQFLHNVDKLDTGHEENDIRRKQILRQGMNFIKHTLKTNFYRPSYTALSFRLDPKYLDSIPFDRTKKFPELPFAIFFIKGMHFFGFHIRFRDLARGGIRTIFPEYTEKMVLERNSAFTECYSLAYTQQLKNKDIPEGGAKATIFLKPYERIESEALIYRTELQSEMFSSIDIEKQIEQFRQEQRVNVLYQAQRAFIENLLILVNCDEDGVLRKKDILDYWNRPEYLYLGPDEHMHDAMIQWIAAYSRKIGYRPGSCVISGKPYLGINHKAYGVTSLGVNVYVEATLKYLGINPYEQSFTVKMSGGPDGDVAGNEICLLQQLYPKTAKLIALTDISGTVYDPIGLDLEELVRLFHRGQSIRHYPPEKLFSGGFLLDRFTKRQETALVQHTLCWKKRQDIVEQEWLSGSDMNYLWRLNVHQVPADLFIPAGGRPRTLNEANYGEFLNATGKPTSRAIVEGANLYLTAGARTALEQRGVLIIKDSSANKTGVICSSFEVLCGLALGDDLFLEHKEALVKEILARLRLCASREAQLLFQTHRKTGEPLTVISEKISKRINLFKDQLLAYLERVTLSSDPEDPLVHFFLSYCPRMLRSQFVEKTISQIPSPHQKAVIACHLAALLVYQKGLEWFPSVVDILPTLLDRLNGSDP